MKPIYIDNHTIREEVEEQLKTIKEQHNKEEYQIASIPAFAEKLIYTNLSPDTQIDIRDQVSRKNFAKELEQIIFLNELDGTDSYTILKTLKAAIQSQISKELYLYTGNKEDLVDSLKDKRHMTSCEDLIR